MIIRKIKGKHDRLPLLPIQNECLCEILTQIILNHTLSEPNWNTINTTNPKLVLSFVKEHIDITLGTNCVQLVYYLKSVISLLNNSHYKKFIFPNKNLFLQILNNLQANPNNIIMFHILIYKIPINSPLRLKTKLTTYYICFQSRPFTTCQHKIDLFFKPNLNGKIHPKTQNQPITQISTFFCQFFKFYLNRIF